jgi:hypothetical protein
MVLYKQRKDSIDKLDAALAKIQQDGIGAKEVSAFMDKLQLFYTNTELGKVHLSLLFYPPTAALKSGFTLGNATGRELQKENVDMSVIECFPYAHIEKSKNFDQRKFKSLFQNNYQFRTAVRCYIKENFLIEFEAFKLRHPCTISKHPVYLGGVVATLVFKHCYTTTEQEPNAEVTIPLLRTPCLAECGDMFYAMEGVHPSYHLMKAREKRACECFRLNMAIFRALTSYAIANIPMNETLTFEHVAKVRKYNDVINCLKTLHIDKELVLHFRASCLHTTDVAHIEKAHLFVQDNNIHNFTVFLHLAFSEILILVPDDKWKTILKRIRIAEIPDRAMNTDGFWAKISVPDDKWKTILKRVRIAEIPDRAMNTGGFWAKISVPDDKWKTILKRIRIAEIPDGAMNTNGFWAKISVPDDKWKTILKRIRIAEIPDRAMNTNGFWAKISVPDDEWKTILKRIRIAEIPDRAMNTYRRLLGQDLGPRRQMENHIEADSNRGDS